ncbi:hypothetical protein GCM10007989_16030 [Devosia pacifica]|uniref:Uncharacterized protein n=1 Tax=Devosia pacifica TaxID=1335967 RepID=A0A918S388_9HYPH|nr:hypothetical protein [Devosia pacifica]GHA21485.1 hypothetical protein GCM10007989_16030 [Devosia pacifica]
MPSVDHDLPITVYVFVGMLAIGQELGDLRAALLLAIGFAVLACIVSMLAPPVMRRLKCPGPRKRVGRSR